MDQPQQLKTQMLIVLNTIMMSMLIFPWLLQQQERSDGIKPVILIVWEKEKVDGHRVPKYDTSIRKKGMVNPKFKEKHKLSLKPLPYEMVDMFLPLHRKGKGIYFSKQQKERTESTAFFCGEFQTICDWKNLKAGKKHGTYYPDFVDFTPKEIREHVAVYILHSLLPSTRLK